MTITVNQTNPIKQNINWIVILQYVLIITLFTAISLLTTHKYLYPHSDHSIYIPFLKHVLNNNLYPNDLVVQQSQFNYTFFWLFLGEVIKVTGASIPTLFFVIYVISLLVTFAAFFFISLTLFQKLEVATIALFFLVFSSPFTLGAGTTIEESLLLRTSALPIVLLAFLSFFRKHYLLAYGLLGFSFLIHPLSAVIAMAMIFLTSLVQFRIIGLRRLIISSALFTVLALPIIIWRLSSPGSGSSFVANPEWVSLMRLRASGEVFPFSWDRDGFVKVGLLLFVFFITWKHAPVDTDHHTIVRAFTLITFGLAIVATIFSEIIPIPIIIQLQFFRGAAYLFYFPFIYYANYYYIEMQKARSIYDALLVSFLAVAIFSLSDNSSLFYIAFVALSIILVLAKQNIVKRFVFNFSPNISRSINGLLLAFIALALLLGIRTFWQQGRFFSIQDVQESNWLGVQNWAHEHTSEDAVFIVPPDLQGFRINSERTVYAEYKDGILMYYNPDFGYEWIRRMKLLGYVQGTSLKENFVKLNEAQFQNVMKDIGGAKCYLVMYKDRDPLNFPILYTNDKFIVYSLET